MSVSFNTYKTNLVQKLYNRRLINKADVQEIMASKTKCGLVARISDCYEEKLDENCEKAKEISKRRSVLPCEIPLVSILQSEIENMSVRFVKILSKKDTKPKVIKLKKEIKKEFGIKSLYLDNNLSFAKKIQKSLRILRDNNIPLADEIIVNSFINMSMGIANQNKRVMLLNSKLETDWQCSTDSPLHIIIHEGIHVGQPDDPAIVFQMIPDKFKKTIDNLSLYASDNFIAEVHAELKTKQLLNPKEFTNEEKQALEYIENLFKQASHSPRFSFLL